MKTPLAAALVFGVLGFGHASLPAGAAPACTEVSNPVGTPVLDESALGTFGPLDAEPLLDIAMASNSLIAAERIPGGILLTSSTADPRESGGVGPSQLTVIEDSGAVRWTRCLDAIAYPLVAPSADGPTAAVVHTWDPAGLQAFDLATGADVAMTDAATVTQAGWIQLASSERYMLFGPEEAGVAATIGFVLLDLVTLAVTSIPATPGPADPELIASYTVTDDGVVSLEPQWQRSAAVYVDGAWQTDPSIIDASLPLVIGSDFEAESPIMVAFTPSGSVAWELPTLFDHHLEAFRSDIDGDVALVAGCTEVVEINCVEGTFAVLGVDAATGAEIWRLPGLRGVRAIGDGYALINDAEDQSFDEVMIETATGATVDGQRWPSGEFLIGCCDDPSFTDNDSGVVLTGDNTGVRLYVPLGTGLPTTTITI